MGLLDGLANQVLGSITGAAGGAGGGGGGLMEAIGGLIGQHPGGLAGLIGEFERGGLGAVAASWVGTGANLPISPDQLQSVLGSQQLQSIGTSLGFSPQQVSTQLAELLPQVIDKLTPNGALPASGEADLLGMLRSLGGR